MATKRRIAVKFQKGGLFGAKKAALYQPNNDSANYMNLGRNYQRFLGPEKDLPPLGIDLDAPPKFKDPLMLRAEDTQRRVDGDAMVRRWHEQEARERAALRAKWGIKPESVVAPTTIKPVSMWDLTKKNLGEFKDDVVGALGFQDGGYSNMNTLSAQHMQANTYPAKKHKLKKAGSLKPNFQQGGAFQWQGANTGSAIGFAGNAAGSLVDAIDPVDEYGVKSTGGAIAGGALKGAAAGAALGPVGAAGGALVGAVTSWLGNKKAQEEKDRMLAAQARATNMKNMNESNSILTNYDNMGTGIKGFKTGGLKLTKQPVILNKNLVVSAPGGFGNDNKYHFTDKTFQEGGMMRVGNGSLAPVSDDAYEVKGDNPNATDDVQVQDAFVDHGEVIKPDAGGLRIFSDHLKVPGTANTFAKAAKKLEKSKSLKGKNNPAQDALIETKLKALFFKQQQLNGDNHGESTEEAIQPAGETPGAGFESGNMFRRGGLSPINKPYHVITPKRIGINAPFGLGAEVMNFHKGGTLGEAVFEHAGFAKELKTEPGHGAGAATFQKGGVKPVIKQDRKTQIENYNALYNPIRARVGKGANSVINKDWDNYINSLGREPEDYDQYKYYDSSPARQGYFNKVANGTPSYKEGTAIPPLTKTLKSLQDKVVGSSDEELGKLLESKNVVQLLANKPKNISLKEAWKYYNHVDSLSKAGYTFQTGGRKRINDPTAAVAFPGYGKAWKAPVNEAGLKWGNRENYLAALDDTGMPIAAPLNQAGLKWGNRGPDLSFLDNTNMPAASAAAAAPASGLRYGNRTKAPLTLNWGSENLFVPGQFSVEGQANQALAKMNPEAAATPPGNGKKSKIDWNNLAGMAGALGPTFANMALLRKTPKVADVSTTAAPRLKRADYSDQLAALKEGYRAANLASGRNTVMGQAKDAAAAANLAEYNRGINSMYGDINRTNTGIANQEAQMGWQNNVMNNQLLNKYRQDIQARGSNILANQSALLANAGDKIQGLAAQSNQQKLDQQKLAMQRDFYNKVAPGLYTRNPITFGQTEEETTAHRKGGFKKYKMGGKKGRYRKAC